MDTPEYDTYLQDNVDRITQFWIDSALQNIKPSGGEFPEGIDTILEVVNRCEGKTVEVGCGRGRLAPYFWVDNYIGVDISEAAIEAARIACPTHDFRLLFPYSYLPNVETTLFYTVMLHIPDVDRMIETIRSDRVVIAEIMEPKLRTKTAFNRSPETYKAYFEGWDCEHIELPYECYTEPMSVLTFSR